MKRPDRKISIGRDGARDIPLGDDSVSAYHAELTVLEDGRLLLTDCQSTNGTFVIEPGGGARRIRQAVVTPDDRLRFGAVTLAVSVMLESWRSRAAPRPPPKPP
ncbi:FHA domain-containing protein, partial [Thiocystis violacea]|uniref:FHA domain-containing protein n=1 Tax=Thiocystis violacea TaxID=13725 RepID=UPI0019082C24